MAVRRSEDDILIGEDEWINFVDLTGRYDDSRPIDSLLGELWPFFDALETHCVARCCGFDAYDFTAEAVSEAAVEMGPVAVYDLLMVAMDRIREVPSTVVVSSRMNNLVDKDVFIQLLTHIATCVKRSAA